MDGAHPTGRGSRRDAGAWAGTGDQSILVAPAALAAPAALTAAGRYHPFPQRDFVPADAPSAS